MIWYLLYPLRGTTEPPQLPPAHPVRRAFQAHGTATARHWQLSLLLSIIVSVLLCYPAVFQQNSPAATGLRNLPKHVWTSTTEVEGDRPADVEVRQVWVHGDYMKAIDHRVLREALFVQRALIADGFDQGEPRQESQSENEGCFTSTNGENWGFHSPLMYWNCSLKALDGDQDLLSTINSRKSDQSALNITLRPSTIFAGKAFEKTNLRSADALVITLFDHTKTGIGEKWNARTGKLAQELSADWKLFPEDGQVAKSRLYEFRFKPMTLYDDLILAGSYMVTAVYVIWRMMQLRAIKSWFGLLITIGTKMTICVIGSFTVCTYLGVDLGRIPRPWFPAVVFCYGLGNIFRLINVVLETPPEMPPQQRIGHALGQVGHLSVAVAGQNLILIWLCSRFVTPWVADFCVFAAVTLVLDLVFHLTFFLAVLSVDVQRMELSDSLNRVELRQTSKNLRPERQSWLSALRQGTLPFSTRFAGSVAILSIILAINWHFFDSSSGSISLQNVRERMFKRQTKPRAAQLWSPPPFNQARTPADWLRIQDHNTARELFGFIKPDAHSFIARIYDPLSVVLKRANGRYTTMKQTSLLESMQQFSRSHAFPAALFVVFLIAGTTLLLNYLLWTGLPEGLCEDEDEESLLTVKTLPSSQTLDIVRLAASPKGHVVGVSLDRTTSLWVHSKDGFSQSTLRTATMKPKLWPIIACALDDGGSVLALCTDTGVIGIWDISASRFSSLQTVDLRGQVPMLFTFATIPGEDRDTFSLLIVTPNGYLIEFEAYGGMYHTRRICSSHIRCCTLHNCASGEVDLVFVSAHGEVHILRINEDNDGAAEVVAGLDPGPPPGSNPSKIKCVESAPALGLMFALRDEEAEIFDFKSRALVHAFQVGNIKPHSFRIMHSARRNCVCGAPAVHSLSIAYTEDHTDHLIMQSFTPSNDSTSSLICLGKPSDSEHCNGLAYAKEAIHMVEPAGVWESTATLSIIGIRKHNPSPTPSSSTSGAEMLPEPSALAFALKQRVANQHPSSPPSSSSSPSSAHLHLPGKQSTYHPPPSPTDTDTDSEGWEAWTLSSTTGEFRSRPLVSDDRHRFNNDMASPSPSTPSPSLATPLLDLADDHLFVAVAGPMIPLGKKSVVVGLGNTVKMITLGKETFDGMGMRKTSAGLDAGCGLAPPERYKARSKKAPVRKIQ